jgi:hypothetical protein
MKQISKEIFSDPNLPENVDIKKYDNKEIEKN